MRFLKLAGGFLSRPERVVRKSLILCGAQASQSISSHSIALSIAIFSSAMMSAALLLVALLSAALLSAFAHNAFANDGISAPLVPVVISTNINGRDLPTSEDVAKIHTRSKLPDTAFIEPEDLHGWNHLFRLLQAKGIEADYLTRVLTDPAMPERETLFFSLNPKESKHLYRKHNTPRARMNALRFYRSHYRYFLQAEKKFGVPQSVILSILQVETSCGQNTGRSSIFFRLARLASAADPENVMENYSSKSKKDKRIELSHVQERAAWLQNEFLPHVAATIKLAKAEGINPHDVRGSSAGAIGMPQFLPGNVERFGADGSGDGIVDVFEAADAIYSVGNFLKQHGWRQRMTRNDKKNVIWHYNHSASYIDTVLRLAEAVEAPRQKMQIDIERALRSATVMPNGVQQINVQESPKPDKSSKL